MTQNDLPVGTRVTNGFDHGTVVGVTIFTNAVRVQWDGATAPMQALIFSLRKES